MRSIILTIFTSIISRVFFSKVTVAMRTNPAFRKIFDAKLGVSEPNPSWFGNPHNEPSNPYWTNKNWLKSRFHFSFAEYSNPRNMGFGVLRVMNDDLVQPNRGFGQHPHSNAEICTYVVRGHLTHKDSMGTEETIERGDIQFMTAGTGIEHSEHNRHKKEPLRFIQMWINPRQRGLKPAYGSTKSIAKPTHRVKNAWMHLVSDVQNDSEATPIKINQDANIHVAEVQPGHQVEFILQKGRQAYILCLEGTAVFTGEHGDEVLSQHDAAEVFGPNTFTMASTEESANAHVILVEMAFTGVGRTDI